MLSTTCPPSPRPALHEEILLVDSDPLAIRCASLLRRTYRVTSASTSASAADQLGRTSPDLIITELSLPDGSGLDVCRRAQALPIPAVVLITTTEVDGVPDALIEGCDGVLLKPFALNLLYARIGRLLRTRPAAPPVRRQRQPLSADDARPGARVHTTGTNSVWPHTPCPYCNRLGVASFDFASHRRAWFACLDCRRVWITNRLE